MGVQTAFVIVGVVVTSVIVSCVVVSFSRGRFRGSESLFSGGQRIAFQNVMGDVELAVERLARSNRRRSRCTFKDTSHRRQGQTRFR